MEGCSNSRLPPPPPTEHAPEKGKAAILAGDTSSNDVAIIERIRRKDMNDSYDTLQSMVPNLFPKATRERILKEATAYISNLKDLVRLLEEKMEKKRKRKKVLLPGDDQDPPPLLTSCRNIDPLVDVTVTGKTVFFGMKIPAIPGIHTEIFQVFEKHKVEVVNSTICRNGVYTNLTVTAVVSKEEAVERLKRELLILLV